MGDIHTSAIEVIRRKKARYCRYVDTKQFHLLSSLAYPSAVFTFFDLSGDVLRSGNVRWSFTSVDAFAGAMQASLKNAQTLHITGGNPDVQAVPGSDGTQLEVIWGMQDIIALPSVLGILPIWVHGGGYYHEIWERRQEDGDWLLKELKLHRTLLQYSLVAGIAIRIARLFQKKT